MGKLSVILLLIFASTACSGTNEYKVGDRGPGGGTIVYVASESFVCGYTMTSLCKHLEVAPIEAIAMYPWSEDRNTSMEVSGANGSAIGTGWQNTMDIVAQGNSDPTKSVAAYAEAYEFGGMTDWFLPSKDELYEIYEQRVALEAPAGINYWSSSDFDMITSWSTSFSTGHQIRGMKSTAWASWPVRAF